MIEIKTTRKELYEHVWRKSILALSKEWGISDVGLAKVCKRHQIPRPGLGYWAKLEHGKSVPASTPLPNSTLNPHIVLHPTGERQEGPIDEKQATESEKLKRQVSGQEISVPLELTNAHRFIEIVRRSLGTRQGDDVRPLVTPKARGTLNIQVSAAQVERALCIMDAVLKALEGNGFAVRVKTLEIQVREGYNTGCEFHPPVVEHHSPTMVSVLGEEVEIAIREVTKSELCVLTKDQAKKLGRYFFEFDPPRDWVQHPTGRLGLHIEGLQGRGIRQSWCDTERKRVEEQIPAFLAGVVGAAVETRSRRLEEEERDRRWAEERRLTEEREKWEREEKSRRKQLEQDLKAWRFSQQLREYIGHVKRHATAHQIETTPGSDFAKWIVWAENVATDADPLCGGLPALSTYGDSQTWW